MIIAVDVEFCARNAGWAVERGDLVIVIDVLRSGTSVLNALANGAEAVIPVGSLREAFQLHSQNPGYVLAGERGGCKPKGFDLGNSPADFTTERVKGRTLVMTTTSGTVALVRSYLASWVLVASFLNAKAVAEKAEEIAGKEGVGVSFVLAGDKGRFSLEDFLCAGAIAERFTSSIVCFSDKAQAALLSFNQAKGNLKERVMEAEHAKRLITLGLKQDVTFSCQLDSLRLVPVYRHSKITLE